MLKAFVQDIFINTKVILCINLHKHILIFAIDSCTVATGQLLVDVSGQVLGDDEYSYSV